MPEDPRRRQRDGLATKRIATALSISPRTVEKHIHHALDKLGVRTRLQAVALLERLATPGAQPDGSR